MQLEFELNQNSIWLNLVLIKLDLNWIQLNSIPIQLNLVQQLD